ncbi:N-acetylneuraminate synthase family protein [Legionella septentrionalis]|uniref:N-acetylneuraminate synthase family protein n=1 Tax=Legionella septentrionalis TaxID=2498109 RepID=UPI0018F4D55C|nr:N-acetylneuraminate synthase family protein [Legionella septentrionalis]
MLDAITATGKPVFVSTGMSNYKEIEELVAYFRQKQANFMLMQCTTAYPCPLEQVGLNVLEEFSKRFACPYGLSDHSGTIYPSLAAMMRGASAVELHVTFSRAMYGPDVAASVTFEELSRLVEAMRAIHVMQSNPVDKDAMANTKKDLKTLFAKSAYSARSLKPGEVLTREDIVFLKPGGGIQEDEVHQMLGRRVKHFIDSRKRLEAEDFIR